LKKGGESSLAFTKEEKQKLIAQYEEWLRNSRAVVFLDYKKMKMKTIDSLRARAREVGGELHVTKNTLLKLALDQADYENVPQPEGSTLTAFAFEDAPAMAKVLQEVIKETKEEVFQIKMGYLGGQQISIEQVKALADLPPLPVMRAMLLGTLLAPASQLVRTLNEPGRQIAAVIKAKFEPEGGPALPESDPVLSEA
jgi:large subunit ribosomal protein L10